MKQKKQFITVFAIIVALTVFAIGVPKVLANMSASITNVSLTSDLEGHPDLCKEKSVVTASFDSSEELKTVEDLKLSDDTIISFTKKEDGGVFHYEGSVEMPEYSKEVTDIKDKSITVTDMNDEQGKIDFPTIKFYPPCTFSKITMTTDYADDNKIAIEGSKIFFSFTTNQEVTIYETSKMFDKDLTFATTDNKTFTAECTVGKFTTNQTIEFPYVHVQTQTGQKIDSQPGASVEYVADLIVTSQTMVSDYKDNNKVAIDGSKITFTLQANQEITFDENDPPKFLGKELEFTTEDNKNFTAEVTLSDPFRKDDTWLQYPFFTIKNKIGKTKKVNDAIIVEYFAKTIFDEKSSFTYMKTDYEKNRQIAIKGSVLTVSLKFNHEVKVVEKPVIFGQELELYKGADSTLFGFKEFVDEIETQEATLPEIQVVDGVGRVTNVKLNDKVTFVKENVISDISITSDFKDKPTKAINGSKLTLKFKTTEEMTITKVEDVAGVTPTFVRGEDGFYTAEIEVKDLKEDQEIKFPAVELTDLAERKQTISSQEKVDFIADTEIEAHMQSDFTEKTIAVDGSKLSFSFKVNHPVEIVGKASFLGEDFTFATEDNKTFTGSYDITELEADREIPFPTVTVKDLADREFKVTTDDSIMYFKKLPVPLRTITNDNEIGENIAIDGNTLTVYWDTDKSFSLTGKVKFAGIEKTVEKTEVEGKWHYEAKWVVDGKNLNKGDKVEIDLTGITFTQENYEDYPFTLTEVNTDKTYYTPIVTSDYSFTTSHGDDCTVIKDDTVAYSFKSDRKLTINGKVKINNIELDLEESEKEGEYTYSCSYKAPEDAWSDCETVAVDLSGITFADDYGHKDIKLPAMKKTFTFYRQLIKFGNVTDIKLTTTNKGKTEKGYTVSKNGDTITVTFLTNRKVNITNAMINNKEVEVTTKDDLNYTASLVITDGNDNMDIPVSITMEDSKGTGNVELTTADFDDQSLYYAPITADEDTFATDYDDNKIAVDGSKVTVEFHANHPVNVTKAKVGKDESIPETKDNIHWVSTQKTKEGEYQDLDIISYSYTLTDNAGNETLVFTNKEADSVQYFSKLEKDKNITDLSFTTSNKAETYTKDGDTLTVKFNSNRPVVIKSAKIAEQDVTLNSKDDKGLEWTGTLEIKDYKDDTQIPVLIEIEDTKTGTNLTLTEKDFKAITYYAPISLTEDSFKSDHKDENVCINGNTVTVEFHSNHPVNILDEKIGKYEVKAETEDNKNFKLTLTINDNFDDLESFGYSLKANDVTGNTTAELKESHTIQYFAPLEKGKNVTNFGLTTTNAGKTPEGYKVVKSGDSVTVTFSVNREVEVKDATIGNQKLNMSSEDKKAWTGNVQIDKYDDDKQLPITMTLVDSKGNPDLGITEADYEQVVFYDEIEITLDSFASNNPNPELAKNGDTVTVKYVTNHPVNIDNALIGGYDVKPSSTDGKAWTMTLPINDNFKDQESFGFSVTVSDNAKNETKTLKNTKEITYFAPISTSDLKLVSSNDKDSTKYIKNGESITVSLKANHKVGVSGTINGETATVKSSDPNNIVLTGGIGQLADQQATRFTVTITDDANNTQAVLTEANVGNQIVYFAPITGSSNMSATHQKNEGFVRNGDTITLNIATNHATSGTSATIQDREVGISGNSTAYTIPSGEGYLPEGQITYRISVNDVAGNTFSTGETTSIIYDRTAPAVQFIPEIGGFTNQTVNINTIISDTNIDNNDIVIKLNEENYTAGGKASENQYEKGLSIAKEGTFAIEASAVDKAGNTSKLMTGTVIIDKTNPYITTIDINLDDSPAYKTGFILGEHFNIKDNYLKNVNCTLTSRTGIGFTKTWDISSPINDEGFMTSSLSAEDMASNVSDTVKYSFYIDGTAPKIIIKNKGTGKTIEEKGTASTGVGTTYEISLDNIWMGNEKPDHFTQLEIKDSDNNVVKNLVAGTDTNSTEYKITKEGEYKLYAKAVDDVGNDTGDKVYNIKVDKDQVTVTPATPESTSKTGLIVAIIATVVGIAGVGTFLVIKKRKGNKAA